MIEVVTFYRFWEAPPEPLDALRQRLLAFPGLKGLAILAPEGINVTASGAVEPLLAYAGEVKRSQSPRHPFKRWKVVVQDEAVTTGWSVGLGCNHLSPAEWDEMLSRDVTLLDVRNDYEIRVGRFPGAIDLGMRQFRDFPRLAEGVPRDKPVLMYCTGGIRCEKAQAWLARAGYPQVYQLRGGILGYFAERSRGHFDGECFVFDERVALDPALQPTRRHALCPRCGQPACAC